MSQHAKLRLPYHHSHVWLSYLGPHLIPFEPAYQEPYCRTLLPTYVQTVKGTHSTAYVICTADFSLSLDTYQ
jgi:hypothetical protein